MGAVLGALAGGVAAFVLAKIAASEAKKKDDEIAHREKKAKVFRVFSVFIRSFNSFGNTYKSIYGMLDGHSSQLTDKAPNQRIVRVLANLEIEQFAEIQSDDIAVFFEAQRDDFVTDVMQAIDGFNAVLNALKTFCRLKEEMLPTFLELEILDVEKGGMATGKADDVLKRRIELLEARAESVITPTLDHMRELLLDLIDIAERFPAEAKLVLGQNERVPGFEPNSLQKVREEFCIPANKKPVEVRQ